MLLFLRQLGRRRVQLLTVITDLSDQVSRLLRGDVVLLGETADLITFAAGYLAPVVCATLQFVVSHKRLLSRADIARRPREFAGAVTHKKCCYFRSDSANSLAIWKAVNGHAMHVAFFIAPALIVAPNVMKRTFRSSKS